MPLQVLSAQRAKYLRQGSSIEWYLEFRFSEKALFAPATAWNQASRETLPYTYCKSGL